MNKKMKKRKLFVPPLSLILAIGLLPAGVASADPVDPDTSGGASLPTQNQTVDSGAVQNLNIMSQTAAYLVHGGNAPVAYPTIQSAIDDAQDGDTVNVAAGRFREQLKITKNIILQGQGTDQTIIESPDSADLVASSQNNLKNQPVYAVVEVQTPASDEQNSTVLRNLTIDGRKQAYLAAYNGDAVAYTFVGIAVRDTTTTIDAVSVMDVRDTYSDYGSGHPAPLPVDYLPQDQPSGANHDESLLLEGTTGSAPHKVTVKNSSIIRFHKTGILAWGPTLEVDIHDNQIQGHGQTFYSTGNGIQISSTDRSGQGGTNGDRRGTTGRIWNNRIYDIGLVIPPPGQPGSYLNLGLYGPSGIMLYQAGSGFVVEGNTLTGTEIRSWHDSTSSNDGGYSNDGIGVTLTPNAVIRNNTITGFGLGIGEGGNTPNKIFVENNTLIRNEFGISTFSGDDVVTLGPAADTITYLEREGTATEPIIGFGSGDRLRVIGIEQGSVNGMIGTDPIMVQETGGTSVINGYTDAHPVVDFTGGSVTNGDGTRVAAKSMQLSYAAGVTTLYIDTEGDEDAAELQVKLAGLYETRNFRLNGGYIEFVPNPSPPSEPSTPSVPSAPVVTTPTQPVPSGVAVLVNGKEERAGQATTTESNGVKTTTVVVDPAALKAKLDQEGDRAVVTIPVPSGANAGVVELNGQLVQNMASKQAALEIKTDKATYSLPTVQLNVEELTRQLGGNLKPEEIKIRVKIAEPSAADAKLVQSAADTNGVSIVVPPLEFTVTAVSGDRTAELTSFNAYVERMIAIPDGVDPNRITTGVVTDPDGSIRHVPTKVEVIGGKYYAKISSLTNSLYSVIWHPLTFADVESHWAKNAVNDMGSRLVIEGVNETTFNPNADMTRAEFAAIVVRGLGLRLGEGDKTFSDVASGDWYAGAVRTAAAYGLITGLEDGTFRPNDKITREQAMTIAAKAMKLTGLADRLGSVDTESTLREFADRGEIGGWARASIADMVKAGLANGRSGATLEAKANMTRAEAATLIQRLLQKSDLI